MSKNIKIDVYCTLTRTQNRWLCRSAQYTLNKCGLIQDVLNVFSCVQRREGASPRYLGPGGA